MKNCTLVASIDNRFKISRLFKWQNGWTFAQNKEIKWKILFKYQVYRNWKIYSSAKSFSFKSFKYYTVKISKLKTKHRNKESVLVKIDDFFEKDDIAPTRKVQLFPRVLIAPGRGRECLCVFEFVNLFLYYKHMKHICILNTCVSILNPSFI